MNSYFEIKLENGEEKHEHDFKWKDISTQKRVNYMGSTKTVFACNHKVKDIHIHHEGQDVHFMDILSNFPKDCEVYQAIRAETLFTPNIEKTERILGRVVGIISDGEVIQELFINGLQKSVLGFKK